jgi:hypothetical protein
MRPLFCLALIAALSAGPAPAAGAPAKAYRAPRTAYGAPDLQGLWSNSALTLLQRPPIFKGLVATEAEAALMINGFKGQFGDLLRTQVDPNAPAPPVVKDAPQSDTLEIDFRLARIDGQLRSSWIVDPADGRIPFTDAGRSAIRALNKETYDDPEGRPLTERCLIAVGSPDGPPMMNTGFNPNYRIVQTRDHVAIEIEMNHDVRIVRLTDRKHPPEAIRPWMGDSVGWWEGDSLVVETTNFNPKTLIGTLGGGFTYSPRGRLTERFTRIGPGELIYEFTVDDPAYFKRTWSAQMLMRATKGPIYEYACHEGNYSLPNALAGARHQEKLAAEPAHPADPPPR